MFSIDFYIQIVIVFLVIGEIKGHGRMIEPPMRSSAWRYGFDTAKNYNDNELNCGGFAVSVTLVSPFFHGVYFAILL